MKNMKIIPDPKTMKLYYEKIGDLSTVPVICPFTRERCILNCGALKIKRSKKENEEHILVIDCRFFGHLGIYDTTEQQLNTELLEMAEENVI